MNKTLLIAAAILVVSLAAGVAGRLALAPVKAPAAAAASLVPGAAGPPPATDMAHESADAPAAGGDDRAAATTDAAGVAGTDASHGETADAVGGLSAAGAPLGPDPLGNPETTGATRASGGTSEYAVLSQLIGKMTPAESATLLNHLDDHQAISLLQSLPLRQVNAILGELPTGRSQRIRTRLFGAAGHP